MVDRANTQREPQMRVPFRRRVARALLAFASLSAVALAIANSEVCFPVSRGLRRRLSRLVPRRRGGVEMQTDGATYQEPQ